MIFFRFFCQLRLTSIFENSWNRNYSCFWVRTCLLFYFHFNFLFLFETLFKVLLIFVCAPDLKHLWIQTKHSLKCVAASLSFIFTVCTWNQWSIVKLRYESIMSSIRNVSMKTATTASAKIDANCRYVSIVRFCVVCYIDIVFFFFRFICTLSVCVSVDLTRPSLPAVRQKCICFVLFLLF